MSALSHPHRPPHLFWHLTIGSSSHHHPPCRHLVVVIVAFIWSSFCHDHHVIVCHHLITLSSSSLHHLSQLIIPGLSSTSSSTLWCLSHLESSPRMRHSWQLGSHNLIGNGSSLTQALWLHSMCWNTSMHWKEKKNNTSSGVKIEGLHCTYRGEYKK